MARASFGLGLVYLLRGDVDRAEGFLQRALGFNEALNDHGKLASINVILANVYLLRGDLNQAESAPRKSLGLFKARGFKMGMAQSLGSSGRGIGDPR